VGALLHGTALSGAIWIQYNDHLIYSLRLRSYNIYNIFVFNNQIVRTQNDTISMNYEQMIRSYYRSRI